MNTVPQHIADESDTRQRWLPLKRKRLLLTCAMCALTLVCCLIIWLNLRHEHEQEINSLKNTFNQIEVGNNVTTAQRLIGKQPDYKGVYPDPEDRIDYSWMISGWRLDAICTRDGTITAKHLNELYRLGLADYFRRLFHGF